jgi:hypothetical protein
MVARLLRLLGGWHHTLPQEREARASIALALEPLQSGDLAFHRAMAPGQGEARLDRREILLQTLGEAGEPLNPAVGRRGHPRVTLVAPALPHERQKGLAQLIGLGDRGVHLDQFVDIRLSVR